MRPDDGGIDDQIFEVRIIGHRLEDNVGVDQFSDLTDAELLAQMSTVLEDLSATIRIN